MYYVSYLSLWIHTPIHLWKARGSAVCTPDVGCARLNKSISDHLQALTGKVVGAGEWSLGTCLENVHKDIITCWGFKGEEVFNR
jgi:hypothetical protein